MDFFSATIYGIIQGLCEFLPISSSGHLAVLPLFMNIQDPGVAFDLLMHVGTTVAVCVYFHKSLCQIIASFFQMLKSLVKKRSWSASNHADFLMINMLVATITSVILILLLKDYAETLNRNYLLISFNLIFFGFLLWFIDKIVKSKIDHHFEKNMDLKSAILIGFSQAFAIFPGVSRSGITLTMSRVLGLSKTSSANFTFLLSVPIILAGALTKMLEVYKAGLAFPELPIVLYATTLSAVVGIITIHYFLKMIKNLPFLYFFFYRLILGLILLKLVWN